MMDSNPRLLSGTVEVDEIFVGGEIRGKGRGYRNNKATVVGAVQRKGDVRLQVISERDRVTLHGFIHKHAAAETEAIYTDEWPPYQGIADANTSHETFTTTLKSG